MTLVKGERIVTQQGAKAFADVLPRPARLEWLGLSHNQVGVGPTLTPVVI